MTKRTRKPVGADYNAVELVGADYTAVVRLSNKGNRTLALPGESCESVPSVSLDWLLRSGKIKLASVVTPDLEA
ncbi:hypothetical protein LCGC14_2514200 [marine sediment metagenome]|uniref:Uncharacterized protein n=1 Tax=marine sediment metagenome TaxID=412755 RepID=A0A0F9D9Y9_9ZZZZ